MTVVVVAGDVPVVSILVPVMSEATGETVAVSSVVTELVTRLSPFDVVTIVVVGVLVISVPD